MRETESGRFCCFMSISAHVLAMCHQLPPICSVKRVWRRQSFPDPNDMTHRPPLPSAPHMRMRAQVHEQLLGSISPILSLCMSPHSPPLPHSFLPSFLLNIVIVAPVFGKTWSAPPRDNKRTIGKGVSGRKSGVAPRHHQT